MTEQPPPPPTPWSAAADAVQQRRQKRRRAFGITAAVFLVVVAVIGSLITLPYRIISPGDATPVNRVVEITNAKSYPTRGAVFFLTVSVSQSQPNLWRWIAASLDADAQVVDEREILGDQTPAQERKLGAIEMTQSQDDAKLVAMEWLGYDVPISGTGAIVLGTFRDTPAAGALERGDVITAVDGGPIGTVGDLTTAIRSKPAGTTFSIDYERDDKPHTVSITSRSFDRPGGASYPAIGVQAVTRDEKIDFPVDVDVTVPDVRGPSAGLAFTLAIIDKMTPGSMTGGKKIAVTGTIQRDGTVGLIGGAKQKAITARAAGATLMLVPHGEEKLAREGAGGMKVVGVKTLDDALRALRANGGTVNKPATPPAVESSDDGTSTTTRAA